MEIKLVDNSMTEELRKKLKKLVENAFKKYNKYRDMCYYIKHGISESEQGSWFVFIYEEGKGNYGICKIDGSFIKIKYYNINVIIFRYDII